MSSVYCSILYLKLVTVGEVGANFSLQLSSRKQFTKTNITKVIVENECEKNIKKIEFSKFVIIFGRCHVNFFLLFISIIISQHGENM